MISNSCGDRPAAVGRFFFLRLFIFFLGSIGLCKFPPKTRQQYMQNQAQKVTFCVIVWQIRENCYYSKVKEKNSAKTLFEVRGPQFLCNGWRRPRLTDCLCTLVGGQCYKIWAPAVTPPPYCNHRRLRVAPAMFSFMKMTQRPRSGERSRLRIPAEGPKLGPWDLDSNCWLNVLLDSIGFELFFEKMLWTRWLYWWSLHAWVTKQERWSFFVRLFSFGCSQEFLRQTFLSVLTINVRFPLRIPFEFECNVFVPINLNKSKFRIPQTVTTESMCARWRGAGTKDIFIQIFSHSQFSADSPK